MASKLLKTNDLATIRKSRKEKPDFGLDKAILGSHTTTRGRQEAPAIESGAMPRVGAGWDGTGWNTTQSSTR